MIDLMPRVYLDFDNVLADTTSSMLKHARERYGVVSSLKNITKYDVDEVLGISKSQMWKCFHLAWDNIETLKPIDSYAPVAIETLQKNDYTVEILTGCGQNIVEGWLDYYGYPSLKVTYVKDGIKVGTKGDIIIDDNPKHIEYAAVTDRLPIVFTRPWNKDWMLDYYERIDNFHELFGAVDIYYQTLKEFFYDNSSI